MLSKFVATFFKKDKTSSPPPKITLEQQVSLLSIDMFPLETAKVLLSGFFQGNKDFELNERSLRHVKAEKVSKLLYQVGCWLINSKAADGNFSYATLQIESEEASSSTDVIPASRNGAVENQQSALEQYNKLTQHEIRNGSTRGQDPLQFAFILKTALDALTPEEIVKLYENISADSQLMTVGKCNLVFPNGSKPLDDSCAQHLIEMYMENNQEQLKLNGLPFNKMGVYLRKPLLAGDNETIYKELQAVMKGRPANNSHLRVALADYYQQLVGGPSSSAAQIEEIDDSQSTKTIAPRVSFCILQLIPSPLWGRLGWGNLK